MFLNRLRALIAVALAAGAGHAAAQQPLTTHCESAPIAALFTVFGETDRMPPDLGRFLQDAALQRIEPYKAFDNVHYVGICWVSAWLITSPSGHVLIDTLYGPYTETMLENIRRLGFDPKDIRQVLITHGHFDHAGGAATLKAKLPNARFAMTAEGWREAAEAAAQSASRPDRSPTARCCAPATSRSRPTRRPATRWAPPRSPSTPSTARTGTAPSRSAAWG
jgi:metallo-beta-lactamase class B